MDMFMEDEQIENITQSVQQTNTSLLIASYRQFTLACHTSLVAIVSSSAMLFAFLGWLSPLWW